MLEKGIRHLLQLHLMSNATDGAARGHISGIRQSPGVESAMSTDRPYVLDSDVFVAAKNSYYAFAICPGFWDSLIHHHGEAIVA